MLVPSKILLVLDVTTARNKKSVRYFYVVIKPPPICCTLYRMQEILYGHVTEFWIRVDVSAFVRGNK